LGGSFSRLLRCIWIDILRQQSSRFVSASTCSGKCHDRINAESERATLPSKTIVEPPVASAVRRHDGESWPGVLTVRRSRRSRVSVRRNHLIVLGAQARELPAINFAQRAHQVAPEIHCACPTARSPHAPHKIVFRPMLAV